MPCPALPAAALAAAALALGACTPRPGDDTAAAPGFGRDSCAAGAYQSYVGQRIDALNDVELPTGTRVMFPTTPATTDFRAERLNIGVGKGDLIEKVFCG